VSSSSVSSCRGLNRRKKKLIYREEREREREHRKHDIACNETVCGYIYMRSDVVQSSKTCPKKSVPEPAQQDKPEAAARQQGAGVKSGIIPAYQMDLAIQNSKREGLSTFVKAHVTCSPSPHVKNLI
jgi:hypothetical protein